MQLINLLPHKFLLWWLIWAPKRILTVAKRFLILVNTSVAFTLNIRLIFTPIYGDYTIVGRCIGFVIRVGQIVLGLIFLVCLSAISLSLPLVWLALPYFINREFGTENLVIGAAILYVLWLVCHVDSPCMRATKANKMNYRRAMKPSVYKLLKNFEHDRTEGFKKIMEQRAIAILLRRAELLSTDFIEKIKEAPFAQVDNVGEKALNYAKIQETKYIELEQIFVAIVTSLPKIDITFSTYNQKPEYLEETAKWIIQSREAVNKLFIWQEDYEMLLVGGIGRGLIGHVTPHLDLVSTDFTKEVEKGRVKRIIGREEEIKKVADILDSDAKPNVLITGDPGSGKTSIVKGIAFKVIEGTEYRALQGKRIVSLEVGGMIEGAKTPGQLAENLNKIMDEVKSSKDIILFIDEIHNLVAGGGDDKAEISTVYSILEPHLAGSEVQCIGATSIPNYRKYIEPNGAFARLFNIVEIKEASEKDTLEILKERTRELSLRLDVEITYPALLKTVELSEKLIHERVLPDKAIEILGRTATKANTTTHMITGEDIAKEIAEMTHIPVASITQDEAQKLLNIDKEMQKMVVGQDKAVKQIAAALKRARTGIRNENKPIASFLFVGTTGVGKTQTAKALAKSYFGDAKNMIRLDMSEYQQLDSMSRLIGAPDGSTKGILTEHVRTRPFAMILLDEIEKAHSNILLMFLQVLDDARLTDSSGTVVDFTNTIIIATSNVGTRSIQKVFAEHGDFNQMRDAAMKDVRDKFAPEFLNRFTGIVVFNPLNVDSVRKITHLLLNDVAKAADEKGIKVSFRENLIDKLMEKGYNPEWGARPMARAIEDSVETYIATKMLSGEVQKGAELYLGEEVFQSE